jgi:hypothetical protein
MVARKMVVGGRKVAGLFNGSWWEMFARAKMVADGRMVAGVKKSF